ncbi:DegV family protein [Sinimarinibacterium sp. CAU 1509]|uniref:DegV family protein n=1 Tax=Sinimarinibacterium sp. CAU 1509 TaxID=2562283 RepID=UPI0010ABD2D2|nr:DegV family protein [Sinimarinibacterium sp. CAU 1509]TJY58232.1 DegV family protein [Sinimarinibacterium sp. CAU 1509]
MRIGVVTDASCDLPAEFLRQYDVDVLPVTIRLGDEQLIDARDPELTLKFYAQQLAEKGLDAETQPCSAEQIRDRFLESMVSRYDYVFCITVTATRSTIFENATKASFAILGEYKATREAAGVSGSFALRVVDSKNMFCGTGVLVAEAAKLARSGVAPNEVRKRIDDLREHICAYMVPSDLYYIRNRGIKKGEKSVGFVAYALGSALDIKPVILSFRGETQPVAKIRSYERAVEKMFEHVAHQIEAGIDTRHVCISYGGDPAVIETLPGYARLAAAAERTGVEVLSSFMSATAAVNVGSGCVAVAYGGELRAFGQ